MALIRKGRQDAMEWTYVEHEGYGPLKFGMSLDEVEAILGPHETEHKPTKFRPTADDTEPSDLIYLDLLARERVRTYKGGTRNNTRPETIFLDDRLAELNLLNKSGSLLVRGIEVMGPSSQPVPERRAMLVRLCQFETTIYSSAGWLMPNLGIHITRPRFWKSTGAVALMSPDMMKLTIAAYDAEPFAADKIDGWE